MLKRNYFHIVSIFVSVIAIFVIVSNLSFAENNKLSGGILDSKVNSDYQDYGAYLIYGTDNDTLFFTSSRPVKHKKKVAVSAEMFFSTRPAKYRFIKDINQGWSKAQKIKANASRISEYIRGSQAISSDRIIFAAERDLTNKKARGTSYLFDLWEMTRKLDGFSNPKPLDNVNNADSWEAQPALSTDGKMLFFVSNREGGKGGLDIWYSVLDYRGVWSKPKLVPNINTPGDERSPHCGADGYFYYASNWDYKNNKLSDTKQDIYRAEYKNNYGILLPINPVLLDIAIKNDAKKYGLSVPSDLKYNSDSDDEFPFITPDRKNIFLTSNRDSKFEKRNIYAYSLPKSRIRLQVNVSEKILDADGNIIQSPRPKIGLNMTLVDLASGKSTEINSGIPYEVDADKEYQIKFSKFVEEECYSNRIEGPENLVVKTVQPFGKDTLFIKNVLITRQKVEIPPIVFNSTDTLPYFITGYWYPNTIENIKEYRKREANGFFNQTGFVDSTGYNYDDLAKKVTKSFQRQIYEPLEEILPAFQDFCRDTLFLKVTVHGYTDPRGLSGGEDHPYRPQSRGKRIYPDKTVTIGVDEKGQPVTINTGLNMWNYNWPLDPNNKDGAWIKLPDKGEKGNILLSKLRAYFTFETFDKAMRKRSPIYAQLRDNGRVILDVEGFGIDKEGFKKRGLKDDPQSRRIEIYLDILRPEELATHKRLPGGKLKYQPKHITTNVPNFDVNPLKTKNETNAEQQVTTKKVDKNNNVEFKTKKEENEKENKEVKEEKTEEQNNEENNEIVLNEVVKPLPPPKEKEEIKNEKSELFCYKIYYKSYDKSSDAIEAKKILSAGGIKDVRIVEILDNFGENKHYELYSGCYSKAMEAIKAMKAVSWATKALNLTQKPVIIR